MVSIKDIARAAQVSHSTVSRALRHSPLVNAQTSALILKIAQERGYTVSAVARSLVTKRTNTIGVVVTTIADPFAGEVVGGIEESAGDHGYSLILATCHGDPAHELRAMHSFLERRVDGILVMASSVGDRYLPHLQLDAQASFRIAHGLSAVVYGLNLTHEVFGYYQGSPIFVNQREFYKTDYAGGFQV